MLMAGALLAGATTALPDPALAIGSAENEDGDVTIEAIGSQRLTAATLHFRDQPPPLPQKDDGLLGSVTRLLLTGDLGEVWTYEANLFLDLSRQPEGAVGGAFASAGSLGATTPYRSSLLSGEIWQDESYRGAMGIDRLSFDALVDPLKLTAGRFPVNYSVTSMLTPNDFFAPFSATAINTIYKPGVDAVRLHLAVGPLSGIEVVRVAGYRSNGEPNWARSALVARANTVLWDFEWALIGGKLAERWVAGGSLQGDIGPMNLRAEGHAGFADQNGDGTLDGADVRPTGRDDVHARMAAGIDVPFEWHNASIAAEYAFVSDGADEPTGYLGRALRYFPDDPTYLGQHYVGAAAGGEIIPILRATVSAIVNPVDPSGLVMTSLMWSVSDESDFVAGVLVPWGKTPTAAPLPEMIQIESEFGLLPVTAFAESRFYF